MPPAFLIPHVVVCNVRFLLCCRRECRLQPAKAGTPEAYQQTWLTDNFVVFEQEQKFLEDDGHMISEHKFGVKQINRGWPWFQHAGYGETYRSPAVVPPDSGV